MIPDPLQQQVLASRDRFNVLFGNAGAAKTTTLAMKVMDLLRRGQPAGRILCVAYSDAAVQALRQRLHWLRRPSEALAIDEVPVTTFARLCQERLEPLVGACDHLVRPTRLVHDTVIHAIAFARERAAERGWGDAFVFGGEGTLAVSGLLHAFRHLKGTRALQALGREFVLTPASAADAGLDFSVAWVLHAYERLRLQLDDVETRRTRDDGEPPLYRLENDPVSDLVDVLTADDPVFTAASHPLRMDVGWLLVDEGHDLNAAMFEVLRQLVEANPIEQAFVVGDVDQVVHADGGADPRFMRDAFDRGIGAARPIELTLCRRFGDRLGVPLGLHAHKRYGCLAERDTRIQILRADDDAAVVRLIVGALQDATAAGDGRAPSVAVLVRHPGRCVGLENELALAGLAVETRGFEAYLDRPEVQFLRVLVAWACDAMDTLSHADLPAMKTALGEFTGFSSDPRTRDIRPVSGEAFRQSVLGDAGEFLARSGQPHLSGNPLLYLGDERARAAVCALLRPLLAGATPDDLARCVAQSDFRELARGAFVLEERVDEAMSAMTEFARSAARLSTLRAWLDQMAQREFARQGGRRPQARPLRLYAIAAAKGLEFDHVVLPGVDADAFDAHAVEERNLFYVAASRARNRLTMTFRQRASELLQPFGRESDWEVLAAT